MPFADILCLLWVAAGNNILNLGHLAGDGGLNKFRTGDNFSTSMAHYEADLGCAELG